MAADSRGGTAIAYETILFQQDIQPVQVPIIFVFVKEEPVETFMGAIAADNDIAFDENIVLLVAVNDQNARACSRNHVVLDDRSAGISFEQSHARCPAPFGVGIIIIGFERQVAIHLVVTDDGVASSRDDSLGRTGNFVAFEQGVAASLLHDDSGPHGVRSTAISHITSYTRDMADPPGSNVESVRRKIRFALLLYLAA